MVDFYEIQWGDYAIKGDLDASLFKPVLQTFQNSVRSDF
jgi:hypothetical protein